MKLYEIKDEYVNALNALEVNEDGEIINYEAVEKLEGDFDEKAEAVALYIKDRLAYAKAIGEEMKASAARKEAAEKRAEGLKEYLAYCMNAASRAKLETPRVALSFRKSTSVNVTDKDAIPAEYINTVTTEKIDRVAIKKAITEGLPVAGAELVEKRNLQIK